MRPSPFLTVVGVEGAKRRFGSALPRAPLSREGVPLADALGREVDAPPAAADLARPGFARP